MIKARQRVSEENADLRHAVPAFGLLILFQRMVSADTLLLLLLRLYLLDWPENS